MTLATVPYTGYQAPPAPSGVTSYNYNGSYEDWKRQVVANMIQQYMGPNFQAFLDSLSGATGPVGQPDASDRGSLANGGTHAVSNATQLFFERYVDAYGGGTPGQPVDAWIAGHFPNPPTTHATYTPDPNSTTAITTQQGANTLATQNAADAAALARQQAADAAALARQTQGEGAAYKLQQDKLDAEWKQALLADATRRYISEGDWGTQKSIAAASEAGQLQRLQMQLGFNYADLAQRATAERDQNDVALKRLALDVAKYDADLAGQPINMWKYAAWLTQRGQVINGLNMSMAASIIPPEQIPASAVAASGLPGSAVAAASIQAADPAADAAAGRYPVGGMQPIQLDGPSRGQEPVMGNRPSAGGVGSTNTVTMDGGGGQAKPFDYAGFANQLLGSNGGPAPSIGQMQGITDSRNAALAGGAKMAGSPAFSAWQGPTTNALGVNVGDQSGQKVDYRQWLKAPWAAQQMKLADVGSVGGYANDFLGELEQSHPRGNATVTGFG